MKERIAWIDIAKAIGIITVLCYHALPEGYVKNFLYQFHLPLFAFISGMEFNRMYTDSFKAVAVFVKKKILTLYVPFVAYNCIFLIFHNVLFRVHFIGKVNGNRLYYTNDFIRQFFKILTFGGGESLAGPLWYLIPAMEFTILFDVILYLSRHFCTYFGVYRYNTQERVAFSDTWGGIRKTLLF